MRKLKSKGDRIWVVNFPSFAKKGDPTRVYYNEDTFLRAISGYKNEVTIQVYDIVSEDVGIGDHLMESYVKSKLRDKRLGVILDGNEDDLKDVNEFMEHFKKYMPDRSFSKSLIKKFESARFDRKAFLKQMKNNNAILLSYISSDVEWYEGLFKMYNFRISKEKEMFFDNRTIENIKQAKENLKNERVED